MALLKGPRGAGLTPPPHSAGMGGQREKIRWGPLFFLPDTRVFDTHRHTGTLVHGHDVTHLWLFCFAKWRVGSHQPRGLRKMH